MENKLFIMAALLVLAGMCFATSHDGDGTYKLYINDSIISDNGFIVKATSIPYSTSQDVIVVNNVTYSASRTGRPTSFTLEQGENHTWTAESGTRNVTVTVVELGYETAGSITVIIVPYAITEVESFNYAPPVPDVKITSVDITTTHFSATVKWNTNVSANGTITLYTEDSYKVAKLSYSSPALSHTAPFSNLTSNTPYYVLITACTEEWCVNSTRQDFTTTPIIPEISNVKVLAYGDTWANIYWETDVKSDERVFYRKQGNSIWSQVPEPDTPWDDMRDYIAYEPGKIYGPPGGPGPDINPWEELEQGGMPMSTAPKKPAAQLAAAGAYSYTGFQIPNFDMVGITTTAGSYAIKSDILAQAPNADILKWLVREEHQINLKELDDQTTYEFKASSCADKCVNSSVYTFTTNRTPLAPTIEVVTSTSPIKHGTSELLYLRFYSNNPGATIASTSLTWNDAGVMQTMIPKYSGDPLTFAPAPSGAGIKEAIISITFKAAGMHLITIRAVDSDGMNATKDIYINAMKPTTSCKNTDAIYYPSDTTCTNKWPYEPQGGIEYNTGIDKCHAFEVCDPSIDYVLADAESCCNGQRVFSANPPQNWGYGYDKNKACDRAISNAKKGGAMVTLDAQSSMKLCKASYLVYGVGSEAVYMKDYYTGEFCCANDDGICHGLPKFTAGPWPESNIQFGSLRCVYTKYDPWIGDTQYFAKKGWYGSDTDQEQNNNAAVDIPPHSSINVMNTGTCVDYSFVITTLFRKAGFGVNEIMSMRSPGHLYNLVWLPGATKFTFIDTVGNTGGNFFTGPGWNWTSKGVYQDHCTYSSDRCSNDYGAFYCPSRSDIVGC